MRIAICDDDPQELTLLSQIMDSYQQERKVGLLYKVFYNAFELIEELQSSNYDLLLLDVMMPKISGMQAAHEIRSFNEQVKIVFLTSSPEFAYESYAVNAVAYLLKPSKKTDFFSILDKVYNENQRPEDGLTIKFKSGVANLLFSKIAYVEVINKRLCFHLSDGSTKELFAPLSDFEATLLARSEFIKVHRSYIVNLWQIQEMYPEYILTHAAKTVPISRRLYAHVRSSYMEHLFLEKGMK